MNPFLCITLGTSMYFVHVMEVTRVDVTPSGVRISSANTASNLMIDRNLYPEVGEAVIRFFTGLSDPLRLPQPAEAANESNPQ